jgi:uncharacterized membrane protein YdjX (TVP38/TMEM64 family)
MKKQPNTDKVKVKNQNKENKKHSKRKKAKRFATVLLVITLFLLAIYLPLKLTGTLDNITSTEQLKDLILKSGAWGYATFVLIQFIQVTFVPIPAFITTIAGVLVFGLWPAYLLSLFSILLGSVFAFWLGRRFGRRMVIWVAGEEDTDKLLKQMEKGKYFFFLMMLFPGFPDDIICIVAGITPMSFKFFINTNLITRPIALFIIAFLGSGQVIPFSGWGIYAWLLLGMFMLIAFYISLVKQKQIETFFEKISKKMDN